MKSMTLLGQQIEVLETSGQLLDMHVSKDLKISGGGGSGYTHNGRGGSYTAPIMSTTTVTTKFFIQTSGSERSVTANGEFNARVGHQITYLRASRSKSSTFLALVNHTLGSWESRGPYVAEGLNLFPASPKLWMWAIAIFSFVPPGGIAIGPLLLIGLFVWKVISKKRQKALGNQAQEEISRFLQANYGR